MKNLNYPISVQLNVSDLQRIEQINSAIISTRVTVLKGLSKSETRFRTIFESILKDFNYMAFNASKGQLNFYYYDLKICEVKTDILFRHISLINNVESIAAARSVYSMFSLFRSLRKDLFADY